MAEPKRLLLVETDPAFRHVLGQVAAPMTELTSVGDFQTARKTLLKGTFDIVTTNLRLDAHNGLHLVYLIQSAGLRTRALVYTDHLDPLLAREAQRAGALYEWVVRLVYSLPAYIHAELPSIDRRDPTMPDRRLSYRGGRRRSDVPLIPSAAHSTVARAFN